jgi:hypothetical protein
MSGNTTTTANRDQITEKELLYLTDFLSWELLAIKKSNDLALQCQDQEIAGMIKQTGQKHQQHYNTILSYLQ